MTANTYLKQIFVALILLLIFGIVAFALHYNQSPFQKQIVRAQTPSIPAFPGAEGFGAQSVGGRGGRVIYVTNLNDIGAGSLRACVQASGPRTCVFSVSGTIWLNGLGIGNPYITIAGQTAPGGGITLRYTKQFSISTHDVIIRNIRFRSTGSTDKKNHDAIVIFGGYAQDIAYNIILDHVSVSWGIDEVFSIVARANNITVQWSIISEAAGGQGLLLTSGARNISLHHNLLAHNFSRNPKMRGDPDHLEGNDAIFDFVNNVIYNWGQKGYATAVSGNAKSNIVANYFKPGPNTTANFNGGEIKSWQHLSGQKTYVVDNIGPTCPDGCPTEHDWDSGMVTNLGGSTIFNTKDYNRASLTRIPAPPNLYNIWQDCLQRCSC